MAWMGSLLRGRVKHRLPNRRDSWILGGNKCGLPQRVTGLQRVRVKRCLGNRRTIGCLEGINSYDIRVNNIQGKGNSCGYNKNI